MRDPFPLGHVRVRRKEGKCMEWPSRTSLFSEAEAGGRPQHTWALPEGRGSTEKGDGASLSSVKLES